MYYEYDEDGFYISDTSERTNYCTPIKPVLKEGYIPQWNGKKWNQVENNIGKKGFLNDEYFEMKEYGKLPKGFTDKISEKIEDAKSRAKQLLREKRKKFEYGGFTFNNMSWGSEEKDELRLNSALKMFDITGVKEIENWKLNDNTYITLTPDLAINATTNLMMHYTKAFSIEQEKNKEIEQLSNVAKVNYWIEHQLYRDW